MSIISDLLSVQVDRRPLLLRTGLDWAHRRAPIWPAPGGQLVVSAELARDVLNRPADFTTSTVYASKLKLGPLVLGMDPSKPYRHERQALSEALRAAGGNFAPEIAAQAARLRIGNPGRHRTDVVRGFI